MNKFIKTFEEYNFEPEIAEPKIRPGIKKPVEPEYEPIEPDYDPNYNPDEEGIERPSVDPDPQAKSKEDKALKAVIDRYKRLNK